MFDFLKRKKVNNMPENKNLENNETVVVEPTEVAKETIETPKEEVKVETTDEVKEEPIVEEKPVEVETPNFEERINTLEKSTNDKLEAIETKYSKLLGEKDDKIKSLEEKVAELERTAPNGGIVQQVKMEDTKTERDVKREGVVNSWFGNKN